MNNNYINDTRFYMVFKDEKNISHKAYHVVNGELVKTPEFIAHLEAEEKGRKSMKRFRKATAIFFALLILSPLVFVGSFFNAIFDAATGEACSCRFSQHTNPKCAFYNN